MGAIFKREFKSFFHSPIGYVILAIFYFFLGLFFTYQFSYGYSDVTFTFSEMFSITVFVIPIITMRLMSDEKRQKTDQAFLTAPVSLWGIIGGKFFAAVCMIALGFLPTVVFTMILSSYASVDWLVYFGNLFGVLLLGSALSAIGIFISSLTESQVVAAVGTFAVSLFIMMLDTFSDILNISFLTKFSEWLSFAGRYNAFVNGVFDYSNIVFFLSFAAVFLFLSVRVLEKRRYA